MVEMFKGIAYHKKI